MADIKEFFANFQPESDGEQEELEIHADSIKQAVVLAAKKLKIDVSEVDYEVIHKGTSGVFGMGRKPFVVLARKIEEFADDEFSMIGEKLGLSSGEDFVAAQIPQDQDSQCKIRVSRSGIWLTITKPLGKGKKLESSYVNNKLFSMRISSADVAVIERAVKNPTGEPLKIGEWQPNPEYDSTMRIEISDDEMKALAYFNPPRFCGRHLDAADIVFALKNSGVVTGIDEEEIDRYLDEMVYQVPLVAAKGEAVVNGQDAYIDYKVNVKKNSVNLKEVEGQVDFKNLDLIENVVIGQLLATKVNAEQGKPGRTVTNKVLPAKSGRDVQFKYGKGTILSDDGLELTAEINGQVVYKNGKVSVEPIHFVPGDVDLSTGNIVFLGSVVVGGSVQDNFTVKAAGNIEVKGSVQKAFLEAEGDIIVYQGINGRDEAKVESTGGSVYAKFIQRSEVIAEKEVIAGEEILQCNVSAGENIICNGKRAQIVGGSIVAGKKVIARQLGAESYAKTEILVGMNPKVLKQIRDLQNVARNASEELKNLEKDLMTLTVQKKNSGSLTPDKEELLQKMTAQKRKISNRVNDATLELEELKAYLEMLQQNGTVSAEKNMYPGVEITIKNETFRITDPYNHVTVALEGSDWKFSNYEEPEGDIMKKGAVSPKRSRR